MLRRPWTILAVGLALAVVAGGGFGATVGPPAYQWGREPPARLYAPSLVFSHTQWGTVRSRLERRGLDPTSARVVGLVDRSEKPLPFALLVATAASGEHCFVPALGVRLGPTTCHVATPMVVFTARDRLSFAPSQTNTSVAGIAGPGVVGAATGDRTGSCFDGVQTARVFGALVFVGDVSPGLKVLRGYDASGHAIVRVDLTAPRSAGVIHVVRPAESPPRPGPRGTCAALTLGG